MSVEFPPIHLKNGHDDDWVGKTLPPEPLHTNLLGPCNDALEKLEEEFESEMRCFYKMQCLNNSGEGPGGKFNGPSIKQALKNLEDLEEILPKMASPFINYFMSISNLHKMCTEDKLNENFRETIQNFRECFEVVHELFDISETLRIHVILDHYSDYFEMMGENVKETNGEHHEALHHTLKAMQRNKGYI